MKRPSLVSAYEALRTTDPRFPWVKPTPDEDDVAEWLETVESEHQGNRDDPDERGRWGHCVKCLTWWPCQIWVEAESLAIQYLGRAADRVVDHSRAVTGKTDKKGSAA